MCGRFVDPNLRSLGVDMTQTKVEPIPRRFNIKPTQSVYAVVSGVPVLARWGLIPSWFRGELRDWKAATINARIEEAAGKPAYRGPWKYGRCLIPAGGYFEWTGDKNPKQPHFFAGAGNEENLWFAGLISEWREMLSVTIMTRAANTYVRPVHDRMPVILNSDEREAWLRGSTDPEIGAGAQVRHHPVKPFGIKVDGPDLIEPI